jgi:hypothetical protein
MALLVAILWLVGTAAAAQTPTLLLNTSNSAVTDHRIPVSDDVSNENKPAGNKPSADKEKTPEQSGNTQQAPTHPFTQRLRIQAKGLTVPYPDNWTAVPSRFANAHELHSQTNGGRPARLMITSEQWREHTDALRRLREIAAEYDEKPQYLEIGGWPAMQRRYVDELALPGRKAQGQPETVVKLLKITTAIAADTLLIRLEGTIPFERAGELAEQVETISRAAAFDKQGAPDQVEQEIQSLRRAPSLRSTLLATPQPSAQSAVEQKGEQPAPAPESKLVPFASVAQAPEQSGASLRAGNGSEIEIAASTDGRNIVVATNSGFTFSNNGGRTFNGICQTGGGGGSQNACDFANPACPGGETCRSRRVTIPMGFNVNGDPSLAVGRSGAFYYALIGFPTNNSNSTAMFVSTDNGQTFNFRANAVTCQGTGVPAMAGPGLCFADQEHIAADRFNASVTGGDQVYSTWRDFDGTDQDPALVCSNDGGTNWTARIIVGAGRVPRIGVGQDGMVYVVYRAGGNIMLQRYSSCANGLTPQGGPATVAAFTPVGCPVPGVDRCNGRNELSSYTVAVDDTNASHVYVTYATNTVAPSTMPPFNVLGNENIIVRDSTDGGATWPAARSVVLNNGIPGSRFMPWVCATGGTAYVSWYDRRVASVPQNDLTDFYGGSAFLDLAGNLRAGAEFRINGAADPQCASGWPTGVDNMNDSESCSIQPQLGGRCQNAMGMGSGMACDFTTTMCPAGETCQIGRGAPKYGDYNGNACVAGRLFTAWASATTQPGTTAPTGIDTFVSTKVVCCVPQIQVPAPPNFAATCAGTPVKATLNVCNTGKGDLEITSIASSNARFSVTTPLTGFPVTVSPDFCFPFETTFTPNAPGTQNVNFTINSNDPVNPALVVAASATGEQPSIATIVADAGSFGDVCVGEFKDLELTINNTGGCALRITSITSSSGEFQLAGVMSFPLVVAPGSSLQIPIRFAPTSFGMKAASLTINSNDPTNPAKVVNFTGNAPSATIVAPAMLDFGKVCPGETKNLTLTIGNSGGCDLIVKSITSDSPEFKVVGIVPFPLVIPPGSTRDVTIQFMPMSFGNKMATLTIMSNDLVTPNKTVTVKGIAPPPIIQVSPDPLDFGKVCLGKFKDAPLTIKNAGECNLTVASITSSNPEFSVAPGTSFPLVVPAGGMVMVPIRFTPTSTGVKMGTLTINSDDPATPMKLVTVKGEAPVSAITVEGDFDFGMVPVGKVAVEVFNVMNTQPCDLLITLICELTEGGIPTASVEFEVVSPVNYPVLLPANAKQPVQIRFKPMKKGLRTAKLLVFGYDPATSNLLLTATYQLRGVGK